MVRDPGCGILGRLYRVIVYVPFISAFIYRSLTINLLLRLKVAPGAVAGEREPGCEITRGCRNGSAIADRAVGPVTVVPGRHGRRPAEAPESDGAARLSRLPYPASASP